MKTKFLILLAIAFFISCDKNSNEITESSINGNWVYLPENNELNPDYNKLDRIYTYNRVDKIDSLRTGLVFKDEHKFIEKVMGSNSSDEFQFINGFWNLNGKDLTIEKQTTNSITSDNNDKMNYSPIEDYEVLEMTTKTLKLRKKITDMGELYQRIMTLSKSFSCDGNMEDWAITPFGATRCGGPKDYIPYNKKMNNVDEFLSLVKKYTKIEEEREKKIRDESEFIYDCARPREPRGIECHESKPVVIFKN